MPTLDLRTSAWIPVRGADGTITSVGLREALLRAHEFSDIRDPMPLVEFGLYRLLVATVMDMCQLRNTRDLDELLDAGRFSEEIVGAYLSRHASRLDLFDSSQPFLQFPEMAGGQKKPLASMLPVIPSGTNALHFHRAAEDDFAVCPEAAARLLTILAPFMTAGGAGLAPSINGAPPWYVLVNGRSLFETLCLNCPVMPLPQGNGGVPAWSPDSKFVEEPTGATLLEGLTWRPRRILLIPGDGGTCALTGKKCEILVRQMHFAAGANARFTWKDPNVAYRIDEDGPKALRPQEDRQIWRDVGPIALLQDDPDSGTRGGFQRPAVVHQYADLRARAEDLVPRDLRLTLYGMRTDMKMKVFEWHREALDALPAPLVLNQLFARTAQAEIERAGKVSSALGGAMKTAYPRDGKSNKAAYDGIIGYARRWFWERLRPDYRGLLAALSAVNPQEADVEQKSHVEQWRRRLTLVGWEALNQGIADLDANGGQLVRAQVTARNEFSRRLSLLLK